MQHDVGNRAIGGGAVGLLGWFFSHLAQINQVLQFILLAASLVATFIGVTPKVRAWLARWRTP